MECRKEEELTTKAFFDMFGWMIPKSLKVGSEGGGLNAESVSGVL